MDVGWFFFFPSVLCIWWVQLFLKFEWEWWFQVRRGADRAEIYSLAFSSSAQWLAVSSDKGTVHVFNLKVDSGLLGHDRSHTTSESSPTSPSAASSLSFIRGLCICPLLVIHSLVIMYGDYVFLSNCWTTITPFVVASAQGFVWFGNYGFW